ncbi:MAG: DUF5809 family protein [Haloferacaceae archaeon]
MDTDADGDEDWETEGFVAPATVAEARAAYRSVDPVARTVVRETAWAMDFDRAEYDERVTDGVIETARDALFASLLAVRIGSHEAYEAWREDYDGEVHEAGSEQVDRVVWHAPPFADEAVAATFASEREAAVGTLRRQAFGRLYRDVLSDAGGGTAASRDDTPPADDRPDGGSR